MARRLFLFFIISVPLIAGAAPLLFMLFQSFLPGGDLGLSAYESILTSGNQWELLKNSLSLSVAVTLLTLPAGIALGILFEKTDLPFGKLFAGLLTVPLLIPPYILAVAWSDILTPSGILTVLIGSQNIVFLSDRLFSFAGNIWILFSVFLPIPMILTMIFLKSVPPELEETALLSTGWKNVLTKISLPIIFPGIVLSGTLVFLLVLGEFTVPAFLRFNVYPVEIFTRFSAFYDFGSATASAMPLLLIALILLISEWKLLRKSFLQLNGISTAKNMLRINLGSGKRIWLTPVIALISLTVLIPLAQLIIQTGESGVFKETLEKAGDSILRSVIYAALGATALSFFGFFTGYIIHKKLPGRMVTDITTFFLFALPGVVIGIGLISVWNNPLTNFIYVSPVIIILGYLAKYLALTGRVSAYQISLIPAETEEAAEIDGAGWFRRIFRITVPLSSKGIAGGWLLGYIFSLRDTGITMLVYPPGHETLPVKIFTLMANGTPELIAALCLIMSAVILFPPIIFLSITAIPRIGIADKEFNRKENYLVGK